jgi:hypothetical protein
MVKYPKRVLIKMKEYKTMRKNTKGQKILSLKRQFINEVYNGDFTAYRHARKSDYCKAQFEWACWIDMLCKDGLITQKEYNNATF